MLIANVQNATSQFDLCLFIILIMDPITYLLGDCYRCWTEESASLNQKLEIDYL